MADDEPNDIMKHPSRWRLVSAFAPIEATPVRDAENAAWHQRHQHAHQHIEFMFAESGEVNCLFQHEVYRICAGTWMVFHRGDIHDYGYTPSADNALHWWFHLMHDSLMVRQVQIQAGRYNSIGEIYQIDDIVFSNWFSHEFDRLRHAALPKDIVRDNVMALLGVLMIRLREAMLQPPDDKNRHVQIVRLIERLIAEQKGKNIYGRKIAEMAGYSHFHFLRIFKQVTGMTLNRYVDKVRFSEFNSLLEAGLRRKEIAEKLGFSSVSALSHWCEKYKTQLRDPLKSVENGFSDWQN